MDFDTNKIKTYITSVILTFMGILTLHMSFMYTFFEDNIYSAPTMILYILFLSLIFCASGIFVRHKWILPVCITIICGGIVWINFYEIAGGLGEIFNTVAGAVSDYFDAEVLFITMTSKMVKFGDPKLFSYVAVTILTLVYSYTISTRKALVIPLLITLASVGIPVFVEVFPSFFAVLSSIVYCVELIILSASVVLKNHRNSFQTELIAILTGLFLMICGGIINVAVPHDDFKQSSFFVDFKDNVQNEIDDMRDMFADQFGEKKPSSIGAGKLGHVNRLSFSGEEVLTVRLPKKKDTVYLKGYIGAKYASDRWEEPVAKNSDSPFSRMNGRDYNQLEMVGAYLNSLDIGTDFTGFKGKMVINRNRFADIEWKYFSPIYPTPKANIKSDGDGCASYIKDGNYYEYYSVSGWEYLVNATSAWGPEYMTLRKEYQDYVEKTYLDVNTTIADELKEKWGDYPVKTPRDRLMLAMDIREYLDENCTYTTAPGKLPANKDFVEYFLNETNEGYCTYFATAAVMMFRSAGVPARYVEGYCFKVTGSEDGVELGIIETEKDSWEQIELCEVSVKDSNAHAWVEFYVDEIGWIDFEVTPGNGDGLEDVPEPETEETTTEEEESVTEEPTTQKPDSEESSEETTENTLEEPQGSTDKKFRLPKFAERIILITFISVVIIIITVMLIRIHHLRCIRTRENVYNDDLSELTGESVLMNYNRFERLMKYSGFVKQSHMTYMDFAKLVEEKSKTVGKGEACRLTEIYEQIHYSRLNVSKEEIEICNSIVMTVYDRIYENIGLVQKFIFRYILNY